MIMKKSLLLLITLVLISCSSSEKFKTSAYDSLAPSHKTIAILPIDLVGKSYPAEMSEEQFDRLLAKESNEIQTTLYNLIARETGREKSDIKIRLKSITTTNSALENAGITQKNIADITEADLKSILDVDVVLRTRIFTNVFLTDTREDLTSEILTTAETIVKNSILTKALSFEKAQADVKCELVDLDKATPVWVYDKKRTISLRDKNSEIMKKLCSDVSKNMPYREITRRG